MFENKFTFANMTWPGGPGRKTNITLSAYLCNCHCHHCKCLAENPCPFLWLINMLGGLSLGGLSEMAVASLSMCLRAHPPLPECDWEIYKLHLKKLDCHCQMLEKIWYNRYITVFLSKIVYNALFSIGIVVFRYIVYCLLLTYRTSSIISWTPLTGCLHTHWPFNTVPLQTGIL